MRLEILNGEFGIFTIDGLEDLGAIQEKRILEQMPAGARLEDLAFFYMPDRDWIVINRSHELYRYYTDIIQIYLKLSPKNRRKCAALEEIRDALKILDGIIFRRRVIYGKVQSFLVDGRKEYSIADSEGNGTLVKPCFKTDEYSMQKAEKCCKYCN